MNDSSAGSENDAFKLLNLLYHFEIALEASPRIDEIGFIHPSQLPVVDSGSENRQFWIGDGKLGVSTEIVFPLFEAAKDAFFAALRSENRSDELILKHSKSVLLMNSDFSTAWNTRKMIICKKQELSTLVKELDLSAAVLSHSHKSDQSWCHRRWVLKMIASNGAMPPEIVEKESELVEKMAERSKMNYRAWNHRCWLVSYMSKEQVENEMRKGKSWASLHVADNSSFHYRHVLNFSFFSFPFLQCSSWQRLLSVYINKFQGENPSNIIREELEWNEQLIKRYVGREALWLHRRVVWLIGVKFCKMIDNDLLLRKELDFVKCCMTINDTEFEDYEAQAFHSASYLAWLIKNGIKLSNEHVMNLKAMDLQVSLQQKAPERYSLWNRIL